MLRRVALTALIFVTLTLSSSAAPAAAAGPTTPTGTPVSLLARADNKLVTADNGGQSPLIASRTVARLWEQFAVVDLGGGYVALISYANGLYVTAEAGGSRPLIANRTAVGAWEMFRPSANADGTISLLAYANNRFVTAENGGQSALIANRTAVGLWEKFTPATEGGQAVPGLPVTPKPLALTQATADNGQLDIVMPADSETWGMNSDGVSGCGGNGQNDGYRDYLAQQIVPQLPALYSGQLQHGCHGDTWTGAYPGRTIDEWQAYYSTWLTKPQPSGVTPDLVIIELGINNARNHGESASVMLDKMTALVNSVLNFDTRIRVVVVDIPPITVPAAETAEIQAYNAQLPGRLTQFGVRAGVARWSDVNIQDPTYGIDNGTHWSDAGNQQAAAAIRRAPAWHDWYGLTQT